MNRSIAALILCSLIFIQCYSPTTSIPSFSIEQRSTNILKQLSDKKKDLQRNTESVPDENGMSTTLTGHDLPTRKQNSNLNNIVSNKQDESQIRCFPKKQFCSFRLIVPLPEQVTVEIVNQLVTALKGQLGITNAPVPNQLLNFNVTKVFGQVYLVVIKFKYFTMEELLGILTYLFLPQL